MTPVLGQATDGQSLKKRPKTLIGIVIVVAIIAAIAGIWGVVRSPASSPSASTDTPKADGTPAAAAPLVTPPPTDGTVGDESAAVESTETTVATLIEAGNEVARRADGEVVGLDEIAAGFVWGELQALSTERQQLGYTQIGSASITKTSVRSVDLSGTPPTVMLDVCIDSSGIDVIDAQGASMKDSLYLPDTPVMHVYGAQFLDGRWKIATHDIPEGASCA